MYQLPTPALLPCMTYSEKYRQITAARAFEREVQAATVQAAPYVPAQRVREIVSQRCHAEFMDEAAYVR